jgi:hypothetical protein
VLVEGNARPSAPDHVRPVALVRNPLLHRWISGRLKRLLIAPVGLFQIPHEAPQVSKEGKTTDALFS